MTNRQMAIEAKARQMLLSALERAEKLLKPETTPLDVFKVELIQQLRTDIASKWPQ